MGLLINLVKEADIFEAHPSIAPTSRYLIEVFDQNIPSTLQNGYRHLVIEVRLLRLDGEPFRKTIESLRREGLKTEPAFSQALGLDLSDPFEALLQLEGKEESVSFRPKRY